MSRSKHQTIRSVFGGKSKQEVKSMISENDPDVQELAAKRRLKRKSREETAEDDFADKLQSNTQPACLILEETPEPK